MSDAEVLEVGRDRRAGPSRRARLALLAVLIALAVLAFVVDRQRRDSEERAVEGCADEVSTAVDVAGRRLATTYDYVRPTLASAPRPALKDGLYRLVAEAATGAEARLEVAATTCEDVSVLVTHDDLRDRRDRCVGVVEEQRSRLAAVAEDGQTVQAWLETPRSC